MKIKIILESGIILHEVEKLCSGTIRLQTKKDINAKRVSSDYVLRNNGELEVYGRGDKGFNFYPCKEKYKVINQ